MRNYCALRYVLRKIIKFRKMRNRAPGGAAGTFAKLLAIRRLGQLVSAMETGSLRIWMRAIARMTDQRLGCKRGVGTPDKSIGVSG
jgi:hypothetical protein